MSPPPAPIQRARGRVEIGLLVRDGSTRLERLYQSGCSKAFLPKTHGRPPEAVLVNTAGGVTGGDRIDHAVSAGAGVRLAVTTQAAERVYRALAGAARIETRLAAGDGASLDWLPQETILFDEGRLRAGWRWISPGDAAFTGLEMLALGRAAMGETVARGAIADQWRIRRTGGSCMPRPCGWRATSGRATEGAATLGGRRALATLIHAAPMPATASPKRAPGSRD